MRRSVSKECEHVIEQQIKPLILNAQFPFLFVSHVQLEPQVFFDPRMQNVISFQQMFYPSLSTNKAKRDSISIMAAILKTLRHSGPSKKMRMVYGSNINYERLGKYIDLMVTTGLIELADPIEKLYAITRKGQDFIGDYDHLTESLKPPTTHT